MTKHMGRVTSDLTISADGYSAGLNQSEERRFGDDGDDGDDGWGAKLHAWMFDTSDEDAAEIEQWRTPGVHHEAQPVRPLRLGRHGGRAKASRCV
jgi:hypothetical protein